jgi:hypothetical protein
MKESPTTPIRTALLFSVLFASPETQAAELHIARHHRFNARDPGPWIQTLQHRDF